MYSGMGGEAGFRTPLRWGVAEGEVLLGNVDNQLDVLPRFSVEHLTHTDDRATTRAIKEGEWDRLTPPEIASFIRLAKDAHAIDFDTIEKRLDAEEEAVENLG